MKTRHSKSAIILLACIVVLNAQGQYAPNFDTFAPGFTLSGQIDTDPLADQWDTNDSAQPDFVGEISGYSTSMTDYWAALGGIVVASPDFPTVPTIDLWRVVDLSSEPAAGNAAQFNVRMAISSSVTPRTNQDSFAWKIRQDDGTLIASINFTPFDATTLQISWLDHTGFETFTPNGISYDALYDLVVNIDDLTGSNPHLTATFDPVGALPPVTVIDASLPLATPGAVGQVAASWMIEGMDPATDYGNNSLIFDNYSLVPEPSAALLIGLGALGASFIRRKRRE